MRHTEFKRGDTLIWNWPCAGYPRGTRAIIDNLDQNGVYAVVTRDGKTIYIDKDLFVD